MTLQDLCNNVMIEGNIRISSFDKDDNETVLFQKEGVFCLSVGEEDDFSDFLVTYMFVGGDGYLHIEVREEEPWDAE